MSALQQSNEITVVSNRKKIELCVDSILYAVASGKISEIHVLGGGVYETRMTINELEAALGDDFLRAHRGCLVSAKAIHNVTDRINLSNGVSLAYTTRRKRQIIEQVRAKQKRIVSSFPVDGLPATEEDYRRYYCGFEHMPFAFADIEMVFNDERRAVDWIFRYGNPALARLEKLPLERLIGSSFASLFSNMDSKWLRSYERAALYGETLEIIDYSPEIDTDLKVICFPTFRGHCGCVLFDLTQIRFATESNDTEKALRYYLRMLPEASASK